MGFPRLKNEKASRGWLLLRGGPNIYESYGLEFLVFEHIPQVSFQSFAHSDTRIAGDDSGWRMLNFRWVIYFFQLIVPFFPGCIQVFLSKSAWGRNHGSKPRRCLEGMVPMIPTYLPKSACTLSILTKDILNFLRRAPHFPNYFWPRAISIFCRQTVDSSAVTVWKTWGFKLLLLWICYLPTRRSPKECVSWYECKVEKIFLRSCWKKWHFVEVLSNSFWLNSCFNCCSLLVQTHASIAAYFSSNSCCSCCSRLLELMLRYINCILTVSLPWPRLSLLVLHSWRALASSMCWEGAQRWLVTWLKQSLFTWKTAKACPVLRTTSWLATFFQIKRSLKKM